MSNLFEISLLALLAAFMALPVIVDLIKNLVRKPERGNETNIVE